MTGTLGAGSPTQVKVFKNATCSGTPDATGTAAEFSGAGIAVTVTDNSSTPLSAQAFNGADSPCSNSISYVKSTPDPGQGPTGDAQAPGAHTQAPSDREGSEAPRTTKKKASFEFSGSEAESRFE